MKNKLFQLLRRLENQGVTFSIHRYRTDSVTVVCTFVGVRTEVDVFEDGHLEYSSFVGDESVLTSEKDLYKLIASHK